MLNLNSILVFSENPHKLAEFYQKVFQKNAGWSDGGFTGFKVGDGMIAFGPHDKVHGKNTTPERMMFNLETEDFSAEVKRIKALGAKVIQEPYEPEEESKMSIATFEDPDGNFFQLVTPMKM